MKIKLLLPLLIFHFISFAQEQTLKVNQQHLDALILSAIEHNIALDKQEIQIKATEYEKKLTNAESLGLFTVSGNLNEFSVRQISGLEVPNFYPRYNFGVRVPLNHFSVINGKKKLIEQKRQLILKESEEINRTLEAEVTTKYIEYIKQLNFLNLQKRLEQFSLTDFNASEKKFADGEIELDQYNSSRNLYYASKLKLIDAESKYLQAKSTLESLANVSLSELGIE